MERDELQSRSGVSWVTTSHSDGDPDRVAGFGGSTIGGWFRRSDAPGRRSGSSTRTH